MEPKVTFAPLFHDDVDALLLLKFVEWPDDETMYCYRLNRLGAWVEFDPEEVEEMPIDDLPVLAELEIIDGE
jgi:hypothetical protein